MTKMRLTRVAVVASVIALLVPATASAGNNTSNFYYSGTIKFDGICGFGTWAALDWTNYDNGSNQIYHTNYRASGSGIGLNGVYVDNVLKSSANEAFIGKNGWGSHTLKFAAHCPLGSGQMSGSVTR